MTLLCVFCSNTASQWNQVFVQPPPEEEVHTGIDQDPRVRRVTHQHPPINVGGGLEELENYRDVEIKTEAQIRSFTTAGGENGAGGGGAAQLQHYGLNV